jgi:hypothetical protein
MRALLSSARQTRFVLGGQWVFDDQTEPAPSTPVTPNGPQLISEIVGNISSMVAEDRPNAEAAARLGESNFRINDPFFEEPALAGSSPF